MSPEAKIAIGGGGIVIMTLAVIVLKFVVRRAPLKPRKKKYRREWKNLQKFCKDKQTWPKAINTADQLLDKALVTRGYKGKSTGERIVAAQRQFSDNDALWSAHKLSRKLEDDPEFKLKEKEVKEALMSFAQGLKDLKAL